MRFAWCNLYMNDASEQTPKSNKTLDARTGFGELLTCCRFFIQILYPNLIPKISGCWNFLTRQFFYQLFIREIEGIHYGRVTIQCVQFSCSVAVSCRQHVGIIRENEESGISLMSCSKLNIAYNFNETVLMKKRPRMPIAFEHRSPQLIMKCMKLSQRIARPV